MGHEDRGLFIGVMLCLLLGVALFGGIVLFIELGGTLD